MIDPVTFTAGNLPDAVLSECGRYRYLLTRRWAPGPWLCVVMLNPSTADATLNDPTIRRVIGFARRWGYGGIIVVNLIPLRATNPRDLRAHTVGHTCDVSDTCRACSRGCSLFGPQNNGDFIEAAVGLADRVWVAWGNGARGVVHKSGAVEMALAAIVRARAAAAWCLGRTNDGSPRHPLYVRGDAELQPFPLPGAKQAPRVTSSAGQLTIDDAIASWQARDPWERDGLELRAARAEAERRNAREQLAAARVAEASMRRRNAR